MANTAVPIPCAVDPANDTELAKLVEKVERHSPRIMEIRCRIETILARLTDPQAPAEQKEESKPAGLIQRLDHAHDKAVGSIDTLDESLARLEALV